MNRFSLSSEQTGNFYDENCHPTILTEGRQNDYLMIWNAIFKDDENMQPTYFCGQALRAGQELVGKLALVDALKQIKIIGNCITFFY